MSRTLTGGTGDVSPQYMSIRATQSANDTTTTITQALPIDPTSSRNPTIVEVLKVYFVWTDIAEVDSSLICAISTRDFGTTGVGFNQPTVIAFNRRDVNLTTSGVIFTNDPFIYDCTDSAGHGILVATPNIYIQVASATTSATNTCDVKILYRYKRVGLGEYIGIVQSQT